MTLDELRTELWEDLGEPSECDPDTAEGQAKLDRWINRAYKKVLFWKFPDGTQMRFPCTEGEAFFKTVVIEGTMVTGGTTTVTLDSAAGANEDQYNGWVLEAGDEKRLIVDYSTGRVATVHEEYDTAPSGAYKLYKRFMRFCRSTDVGVNENILLSPVGGIAEIRMIEDLAAGQRLDPGFRTDSYLEGLTTPGTPTEYVRRQDDILFDCPVDEARWFRMEYVRIPPDLSGDGDEPEVPEYFHEAILLWATWKGLRWMHDFSAAYSTKKDLMDFMSLVKQQGEMSFDRESGQVEVE